MGPLRTDITRMQIIFFVLTFGETSWYPGYKINPWFPLSPCLHQKRTAVPPGPSFSLPSLCLVSFFHILNPQQPLLKEPGHSLATMDSEKRDPSILSTATLTYELDESVLILLLKRIFKTIYLIETVEYVTCYLI